MTRDDNHSLDDAPATGQEWVAFSANILKSGVCTERAHSFSRENQASPGV